MRNIKTGFMSRNIQDINNVTCGIVLFNSELNKVWLKRRADGSLFANTFCIPGGKVKRWESLEKAVERELFEETGLTVKTTAYLKVYFYNEISMFVFTGICDDDETDMVEMDDVEGLILAPNIDTAIRDAREYYNRYSKNLNLNIRWLYKDIIDKVSEHVICIGDKLGYDHFLCQKRIGTLGSAVGLNILLKTPRYDDIKQRLAETVIGAQISDGGWGIKSHDNKESILESTCYSLIAVAGVNQANKSIDAALGWLFENRLNDGSWGSNKNSTTGKVTSTCLAIRTLLELGRIIDTKDPVAWISSTQNRDGGWGFEAGKTSNVTATSQVIMILARVEEKSNDVFEKAKKWLVDRVNGSEIREEAEVSYLGDKRFEYKHSTVVYALTALAESGCLQAVNPGIILHFISAIIDSRDKNGFWEHEATPGFYPIWHTYNILNLLMALMKKCEIMNFSAFRRFYEHYKLEMDFVNRLTNIDGTNRSQLEQALYY